MSHSAGSPLLPAPARACGVADVAAAAAAAFNCSAALRATDTVWCYCPLRAMAPTTAWRGILEATKQLLVKEWVLTVDDYKQLYDNAKAKLPAALRGRLDVACVDRCKFGRPCGVALVAPRPRARAAPLRFGGLLGRAEASVGAALSLRAARGEFVAQPRALARPTALLLQPSNVVLSTGKQRLPHCNRVLRVA